MKHLKTKNSCPTFQDLVILDDRNLALGHQKLRIALRNISGTAYADLLLLFVFILVISPGNIDTTDRQTVIFDLICDVTSGHEVNNFNFSMN